MLEVLSLETCLYRFDARFGLVDAAEGVGRVSVVDGAAPDSRQMLNGFFSPYVDLILKQLME